MLLEIDLSSLKNTSLLFCLLPFSFFLPLFIASPSFAINVSIHKDEDDGVWEGSGGEESSAHYEDAPVTAHFMSFSKVS